MIDFGICTIEYQPEHRKTVMRFSDGTEAHAVPHDTPEYEQHARKAGCLSVDQYAYQHEICHAIYGLTRPGEDKTSPALWAVAHGLPTDTPEIEQEEAEVQQLHAAWNSVK